MKVLVEESGLRLDAYLSQLSELGLSRSYLKKLIEAGNIQVNGKACKASYKLELDDEIELELPEAEELQIKAEKIPIDIVYEDEHLLVINKPIAMVVHPAPGLYSGTLVNAVLHHCKDQLSDINGVLRPGIVHRLDKDTSGLIVVAKSNEAHQSLAKQIQDRTCKRRYRAIVQGKIKENRGEINKAIGRDTRDRKRMSVSTAANARHALTRYQVLEHLEFGGKNYSYIECELDTGRTHQIRVHMASINFPIIGDLVYGASKKTSFNVERPMLHAYKLSFKHPLSGEDLSFEAPEAPDFKAILDILRPN
ncbi:MAG: RluA family pseudouridine synthase [Candidatus Melainabacteria bacterium]|nr:RluA family pseudouridine synthase [Candidatus Melainabacteria bacterium]